MGSIPALWHVRRLNLCVDHNAYIHDRVTKPGLVVMCKILTVAVAFFDCAHVNYSTLLMHTCSYQHVAS